MLLLYKQKGKAMAAERKKIKLFGYSVFVDYYYSPKDEDYPEMIQDIEITRTDGEDWTELEEMIIEGISHNSNLKEYELFHDQLLSYHR